MNTPTNWRKRASTLVLAAAVGVGLAAAWLTGGGSGDLALLADASQEPRVVDIKAKKFAFSPAEVTLKKGEPVVLRLTSEDRTHGFLLKPLKIDTDIKPGQVTEIAVTPTQAGSYIAICDHYCGTGHGNMKLKLTVIE
ncbi:MAG TPA: cupredoxin domain-containing protein [Candidatus Binataceae bacterium]|nr:cupredoxin domain-containing protein [Candidatus Binataceae bacterium]